MRLAATNTSGLKSCYNSNFDQYRHVEAFGVHPDWTRQLSKFASVQECLRERVPLVRQRLEVFSCLQITMLDIDGFRFDKAAQVSVDAQGEFSAAMRKCAASVGNNLFFFSLARSPAATTSARSMLEGGSKQIKSVRISQRP